MIIIKIHNVFNFADAQPVIDAIEEFNKDKSAIWVPKEWASVEGVGDFEKTTVISVLNTKKPIKPENIKQFLQDAYDKLGGEDFLKENKIFLPENFVDIEVLEKRSETNHICQKAGIVVYKVKTEGLPAAQAVEMVENVKEMYSSNVMSYHVEADNEKVDSINLDVYTVDTKIQLPKSIEKTIFIPDSLLDIEII